VSNDYILTYQKSKGAFEPILYTKYPMIPYYSESFLYNDQSGFYHVPFEDKIFRYNADSSRFDPLFQLILNSEKIPSDLLEGLDILALQSFLLDSEMSFASFSGSEYGGNYFLFYYRDLENYNFVRISKNDFDDNISISWKGLFDNADVPVPFASSAGMYYSIGYLSESDYKTVSTTTGILDSNIEFKDFENKLFLFKMKYYPNYRSILFFLASLLFILTSCTDVKYINETPVYEELMNSMKSSWELNLVFSFNTVEVHDFSKSGILKTFISDDGLFFILSGDTCNSCLEQEYQKFLD
jgi:hypothetical protein